MIDPITLQFHLRDVLASTAHLTGLRAGPASEELVAALYARLVEIGIYTPEK